MSPRRRRVACAGAAAAALLALGGGPTAAAAAPASELTRPVPGSPDGRVYEMVSPAQKAGKEAGTNAGQVILALARSDGERVLYGTSGAVGPGPTGLSPDYSVSERTGEGWRTRGVLPRPVPPVALTAFPGGAIAPAAGFSTFAFVAKRSYVAAGTKETPNVYLTGEDAFAEPTWASRPEVAEYNPAKRLAPPDAAGPPSDAGDVFFTYLGYLLPTDAPRAALADEHAWGLYEWTGARLLEAGTRPDGTLDPYGAVPAATEEAGEDAWPEFAANQVSADGSSMFFLSPDPGSGHPPTDPVELYRRREGRSVLVSRDELEGGAAPGYLRRGAATGLTPVQQPGRATGTKPFEYVAASRTGAVAFFRSMDKLARSAGGGLPEGSGPFTYLYDAASNVVSYLPGVTGPVLASTDDGSTFAFIHYRYPEGTQQQGEEEGTAAEDGVLYISSHGHLTVVGEVPAPAEAEEGYVLSTVRLSRSGEVLVFGSNAPIPQAVDNQGGPANNGSGVEQIYRYSLADGRLVCISCAPGGAPAPGPARLSNDNQPEGPENRTTVGAVVPTRGITPDGAKVFFDTPVSLVPQDVNGVRDVYEWDAGHLYLISSGTSPQPSFFLDNGENGRDVFFTTADGLVAADTDGGYDVYDAREAGGFPATQEATGCGASCQLDALAPPPAFPEPASETFAGVPDQPVASSAGATGPHPAAATRGARLAAALARCHHIRSARRRRKCESDARRGRGAGARHRGDRRRP